MKKLFSRRSVLSGFVILLLGVGFGLSASTSQAQKTIDVSQGSSSGLMVKLDKLVDQIAGLTGAISDAVGNNEDTEISTGGDGIGLQEFGGYVDNPSCLDGYLSWPTSNTFKNDAPWSTHLMYGGVGSQQGDAHKINTFLDVNGDGLNDYIYSKKYLVNVRVNGVYTRYNTGGSCVLLNNGSGWDIAYKCMAKHSSTGFIYYGDCADLSS